MNNDCVAHHTRSRKEDAEVITLSDSDNDDGKQDEPVKSVDKTVGMSDGSQKRYRFLRSMASRKTSNDSEKLTDVTNNISSLTLR